jgi:hypothetical protein
VLTAAELNTHLRDNLNVLKTPIDNAGNLSPAAYSTLTIATGAITVTGNRHDILNESAAAEDTLETITSGTNVRDGHIVILRPNVGTQDILVKGDLTGNISLFGSADFLMERLNARLVLERVGTQWREISRTPAGIEVFSPTSIANVNTASLAANTWVSWATTSGVGQGGHQAALVYVKLTDSTSSAAEIRRDSTDTEAMGWINHDGVGSNENWHGPAIIRLDANGEFEYRYGNVDASAQDVGVELYLAGRFF